MRRALLLSGGVDSIALCYWLDPDLAITIDYGQAAAKAEFEAAQQVCAALDVKHEFVSADCSQVGFGNMLPIGLGASNEGPARPPSPEWWPFRNQLVVTLGASRCVLLGFRELLIGTVASDSQHRDGTAEFVDMLAKLLEHQEGNLSLVAPALGMTSVDLVRTSRVPRAVLCWAHSCHVGNIPCGTCRGCNKYREVFQECYESLPS
jgi:7-cyano-7-deazaguanine synthase